MHVIMGQSVEEGPEEFRTSCRLAVSSFDHTDTLTIILWKHSSKCSGVVAYGAFDLLVFSTMISTQMALV